ncbi:MAG: TIR domain-containing protein [Bacteroidetes bacterium]|nr:MAG: TIR domain-containing protein [Bacteroidota bacterium]
MNTFQAKELFELLKAREYATFFIKLYEYGVTSYIFAQFQKEFKEGTSKYDPNFYERLLLALREEATYEFTSKNTTIDIFFSFSSKNMGEAQVAVNKLRSAGFSVFFSGEDLGLQIGTTYFGKVQEALEQATHFALYFTEEAKTSNWVRAEYENFYQHIHLHNPKERRFFIIYESHINHQDLPIFLRSTQTCKTEDVIAFLKQPELEAEEQARLKKEEAERQVRLKKEQEEAEKQARLKKEQEEAERQARLKKEQEEAEERQARLKKEQEQEDANLSREESTYQLAKDKDQVELYYYYLNKYKKGKYVNEVRERIEALEQKLLTEEQTILGKEQEEAEKQARLKKEQEEAERQTRLKKEQEEAEKQARLKKEQEEVKKQPRLKKEQEGVKEQTSTQKNVKTYKLTKYILRTSFFIVSFSVLWYSYPKIFIANKKYVETKPDDKINKKIHKKTYKWEDLDIKAGVNKKYGIVHKTKKDTITDFMYDFIYLNEKKYTKNNINFAVVKMNNKIGAIDSTGSYLVPLQYEELHNMGNIDMLVAKTNTKYGVIDLKNRIKIQFQYERLYRIRDTDMLVAKRGTKYGIIDFENKIKVQFQYDSLCSITYEKGSFLMIAKKGSYWGIINQREDIVLPIKYENIDFYRPYSQRKKDNIMPPIIAVKLNGLWGGVDIKGNTIIKFKYQRIYCCNEDGICIAVIGNKFGYIDKNENIIIPFSYEEAWAWTGSYGYVKLNNRWYMINKQQQLTSMYPH